METPEQNDITPLLYNWKALEQLEWEKNFLSVVYASRTAAAIAGGALFSPALLIMASAYKPLIQITKLARIIKVMRSLLEEFKEQGIQIFPCLKVPEHEPIDLFIIVPEKAYFLISIRSKSSTNAKVVYNEANETLYIKHKGRSMRKWLPCPLIELSDYHAWLGKNRQKFGITANAIRKYPVIKTLVLWKPMEIEQHREHLYSTRGGMTNLTLARKGTALVIEEEKVLDFVKACLVQAQAKATK